MEEIGLVTPTPDPLTHQYDGTNPDDQFLSVQAPTPSCDLTAERISS